MSAQGLHNRSPKEDRFTEISRVRFHKLNASDIANYFRVVNPIDKAGAYAAQAAGRSIIASVEGSFTNVIGLPMERTTEVLAQFDFSQSTRLDRNFGRGRRSACRLSLQHLVQNQTMKQLAARIMPAAILGR